MSADPIKLETYELALLRHTVAYHEWDPDDKERIFREHLAYTLSLVASGQQLAAGPVKDSPAEDTTSAAWACSSRARWTRCVSW